MSDKITFTLHELVAEVDAHADQILRARYGITGSQFVALAVLADVEPTDITRLAACLGVTKAAVSKRVPGLVEAGWVTTRQEPGQGRRVILELTTTARELVATAGPELDARFAALVSHPDAEGIDLVALNDQLATLTRILRENGAEQ
ncbi:MarR family winged helix-turn-helix transcriptional regulator [Demequina sp. NBRC 110057]|uniref:MarR family winged helix-turn-helix transcriptional regulator n=1 Tax=Demequina sp. NBRC 110057 TaxID=1570346 RepID=UPI0009FBDEB5|nr:MarR family winged helix-turn-helix transcriptional regulator [Demequina sp. NBRC 110057]